MIRLPKGFTSDLDHISLPDDFVFVNKKNIRNPISISHLDYSKKELDKFVKRINKVNPKFDAKEKITSWSLQDRAKILAKESLIEEVSNKAIEALNNHYIVKGTIRRSHYWLTSYSKGSVFHIHSDNGADSEEGNIHGQIYQPTRKLTAVFYLNSQGDFTGGDLVFHSIFDKNGNKLRISPNENMLLVFQSNVFFRHGVEEVTSGNRTIIGMTFDVDK